MNLDSYESWGRYPKVKPADVVPIVWRSEIPDLDKFSQSALAYAFGKSYGDSCLNEGGILLDVKSMNRFIEFDRDRGVFKCETGATLAEILNLITPEGFFLKITPGTKFVSVGGCIANDVHGKNHHVDGAFGNCLRKFELVRSDGERIICSPDENSDIFRATIGGLGLTGLITWAEFELKPNPTPFFKTEHIKFRNLDEFFVINEESEKRFDYTVAWIDTTSSGSELGRGIYNRGNSADPTIDEIPEEPKFKPKSLPFEFPFINGATTRAFNELYYGKQQFKIERQIEHYDSFFYPLDAALNWNRAYGKNGFLQYQFVIPFGFEHKAMRKILTLISDSGMSSFLTVLKTFGDIESLGMMSFPRPGVNMAVDFAMRGEKTLDFLKKLDAIVVAYGGAIYPAKDARMPGKAFRGFYPNYKEFSKYIDPKFSSSFWRRVMAD